MTLGGFRIIVIIDNRCLTIMGTKTTKFTIFLNEDENKGMPNPN
jgi:hypothetical protein